MSEWETKKLDEVTATIFSGGTPNTQNDSYWNGGINWLSSGETRNKFIYSTIQTISALGVENSSTKKANQNDVVIASAGQGKTRGQVSMLMTDTFINQSIIALRADSKNIIPLWLFYNLSWRYNELRQISDSHSIRGSLTTNLLKNMFIKFPSINEQKKRTEYLYCLDKK
ncbi:restriction endonuclease subunit S [Avibacterium endocarditidis]